MKFIILDRDGVINYESKSYIRRPEEWKPIPGSLEAIRLLNRAGYTVIVATNQSGIARGYYTVEDLQQIHQKMASCLKAIGGIIDRIFYCPHHPKDACLCRKPGIGLLQQVSVAYQLDLKISTPFFIGDSWRDVQAAFTASCRPLLVLTGNGRETLQDYPNLCEGVPIFPDLLAAVVHLLHRENGSIY